VPRLSLDLGSLKLATADGLPAKELPRAGQYVLAVRCALPSLGDDVITKFFTRYAAYNPLPFATIGEEGLGAHLPTLQTGIELDIATMGVNAAPQLLSACRHTVLVAMAPSYAAAVLAEGAPATLIGRIVAPPVITLKNSPAALLRLPQGLLKQWVPALRCTTKGQAAKATTPVQISTDRELVLGGISYTGNHLTSLLALVRDVCLAGGDMHGATLSATLSLPPASLNGAISVLLAYHRLTSELALPTGNVQILYDGALPAPTMTVGILAKRRKSAKVDSTALQTTLACGNFSHLREIIYKI
jgi:hypothetical protein